MIYIQFQQVEGAPILEEQQMSRRSRKMVFLHKWKKCLVRLYPTHVLVYSSDGVTRYREFDLQVWEAVPVPNQSRGNHLVLLAHLFNGGQFWLKCGTAPEAVKWAGIINAVAKRGVRQGQWEKALIACGMIDTGGFVTDAATTSLGGSSVEVGSIENRSVENDNRSLENGEAEEATGERAEERSEEVQNTPATPEQREESSGGETLQSCEEERSETIGTAGETHSLDIQETLTSNQTVAKDVEEDEDEVEEGQADTTSLSRVPDDTGDTNDSEADEVVVRIDTDSRDVIYANADDEDRVEFDTGVENGVLEIPENLLEAACEPNSRSRVDPIQSSPSC